MKISGDMSMLCLHIILFINMVHSFVLLTANIDDVKRIARKFVSDSLAEQISEFVSKITNANINVSEENELNTQLENNYDDKSYKTNDIRSKQSEAKTKKQSINMHKQFDDVRHSENIWDKNYAMQQGKVGNDIMYDIKAGYKVLDDHPDEAPMKSATRTTEFDTKSMLDFAASNGNQNTLNKQKNKIQTENRESTIGYKEQYGDEDMHKQNPYRFALMKAQNVSPKNVELFNFNFGKQKQEPTTEKAKYEFDQYDNTKYPKPDFIATSGPLSLPKVPLESNWFEGIRSDSVKSNENVDKEVKKRWF